MYVSIRDALLLNGEFSSPVEGLRYLGLDAVEIALSPDFEVSALDSQGTLRIETDRDAEDYRDHLADLGVRACAFLTAYDFGADRDDAVKKTVRALELAHILGMDVIRVDSAMAREHEFDFQTRVNLFAEGLGEAIRRTDGINVAMGIENHGAQGNNLAFHLNVYKRVASERLGITLDSGNFYWRGYPLSEVYGILEVLAPYAKHTHFKNINYPIDRQEVMREAGWEYGTYVSSLETGDIDHALVVRLLAGAGYNGDLCIEDESLGKLAPGEARIETLRKDVQHVKGILAHLA